MKKPTKTTQPTTIEALAKTVIATTHATEKFQGLVYTLRKSLGLNTSVKDKSVDAKWTEQLLTLLHLIEATESTKHNKEIRLSYQHQLLGTSVADRHAYLFQFRESYKLFLRNSNRDIPRDLDKFFDALYEAIAVAV
jgi:hypothetical protein